MIATVAACGLLLLQAARVMLVRNYFGDEGDVFEVSASAVPEEFRLEVSPTALREVVAYLGAPDEGGHVERWSQTPALLVEVAKLSNYLNVVDLTDRCCLAIAQLLRGKSPPEVRAIFGMPEEEYAASDAAARRRLQWLLE